VIRVYDEAGSVIEARANRTAIRIRE